MPGKIYQDDSKKPLQLQLFLFYLAIILQIYFFAFIPTDNAGDPGDYIEIAKNLLNTNNTGYLRFIGYPIFLKITSLNFYSINLIFFSQSLIFLFAIHLLQKAYKDQYSLSFFLILPALIPSLAYSQKLLFPDGLILSLLLFFLWAIKSEKFVYSLLISGLLILIKLFFVFIPFITLINWLCKRKNSWNKNYIYSGYFFTIIWLVSAVFFLKPFPIYQTVVLDFHANSSTEKIKRLKEYSAHCDGLALKLSPQEMRYVYLMPPAPQLEFMPITPGFASQNNCKESDIRSMQQEIILKTITDNPIFLLEKFLKGYTKSLFILPEYRHLSDMLSYKANIANSAYNQRMDYSDSQLWVWERNNLNPPKMPGNMLLGFTSKLSLHFSNFLLLITLIGIFLSIYTQKRAKISFSIEQSFLIQFWLSFNFLITCFAFILDRYILINYYILIIFLLSTIREISSKKSTDFNNLSRQLD